MIDNITFVDNRNKYEGPVLTIQLLLLSFQVEHQSVLIKREEVLATILGSGSEKQITCTKSSNYPYELEVLWMCIEKRKEMQNIWMSRKKKEEQAKHPSTTEPVSNTGICQLQLKHADAHANPVQGGVQHE